MEVPRLGRLRWSEGQLMIRPGLLVGQDLDAWQAGAEKLRVALGASRLRVVPNEARTSAELRIGYGDPLATSHRLILPRVGAPVRMDRIPLGRREDGGEMSIPLGPHMLLAGSSGAGKAGGIHGVLAGLGPAIRDGVVQVHGIDLKGGMELRMAGGMLTRCATTPPEAVALLEDAAAAMSARATTLAGRVREHTPTPGDPFVLILIDELAALTAYLLDRELRTRAGTALSLLLSQGRAAGYAVFACLQDPRKEVLPMRGLFTQTIGLRLRDRTETDMVVGEHARHAGADCHLIPLTAPGVGYLVPEDGSAPVRFRLPLITDADIHALAATFPTPVTVPIVVPCPAERETKPRRIQATSSSKRASFDGGEAA